MKANAERTYTWGEWKLLVSEELLGDSSRKGNLRTLSIRCESARCFETLPLAGHRFRDGY